MGHLPLMIPDSPILSPFSTFLLSLTIPNPALRGERETFRFSQGEKHLQVRGWRTGNHKRRAKTVRAFAFTALTRIIVQFHGFAFLTPALFGRFNRWMSLFGFIGSVTCFLAFDGQSAGSLPPPFRWVLMFLLPSNVRKIYDFARPVPQVRPLA